MSFCLFVKLVMKPNVCLFYESRNLQLNLIYMLTVALDPCPLSKFTFHEKAEVN